MITQCTLKWSFVLLLGSTLALSAQQSANPVQDATNEAIRMQEKTILMRQQIALAKNAQKKGDLIGAVKHYEEAYKNSEQIGSNIIASDRAQIVAGLATVRMQLANLAYERGDYGEAEIQ